MEISIITLFPEMFKGPFDYSIIKRAIDKKIIKINFVNLREFGIGKHKLVDDTPYGGGNGMVLRADVLSKAIEETRIKKLKRKKEKVVLLSAHGNKFDQKKAEQFSNLSHLILVSGHYEGFDERIKDFIDEEVSVGDFILTGGEIPAMFITDSVARLVKDVIKENSKSLESFSPYLEHPQYTKPREFNNSQVPKVLLSGNHAEIEKWKKGESLKITSKLRPDLVKKAKS
jgi:tRNA (guanine37-N1)-methyltransferase